MWHRERERRGIILEPADKLCSRWDREGDIKGMHADSVAMVIIIQLGYPLIRWHGCKKKRGKKWKREGGITLEGSIVAAQLSHC